MEFREALEINIRHDYWGDTPAPLRVVAADPECFRQVGLVLRSGGLGAVLAAPVESEALPERVSLDIFAEDPQVIGLSRRWRANAVPVFAPELPPVSEQGDTRIAVALTGEAQSDISRRPGDRRLCRINLTLDPARFPIICTVTCEAVQALWTYHIVGKSGGDPIRIVDESDAVVFDDLGEEILPDGRTARVLRSSSPVPIRRRNGIRLALQQDQPPPYDPEILIPVLPVGGANLRPVAGGASSDILQSDIYVSL